MPPRHPYPAALDDCLAVYQALLKVRDPADVFVGGTSAGGNLAAASLTGPAGNPSLREHWPLDETYRDTPATTSPR